MGSSNLKISMLDIAWDLKLYLAENIAITYELSAITLEGGQVSKMKICCPNSLTPLGPSALDFPHHKCYAFEPKPLKRAENNLWFLKLSDLKIFKEKTCNPKMPKLNFQRNNVLE